MYFMATTPVYLTNRLVGIYMRMVQISVRDGLKGVR